MSYDSVELLETQCAYFSMVLGVIPFCPLGMCAPLLESKGKMEKENFKSPSTPPLSLSHYPHLDTHSPLSLSTLIHPKPPQSPLSLRSFGDPRAR